MKKKLSLKDFKVTSFVTSENAKNIIGGGNTDVAGFCWSMTDCTDNGECCGPTADITGLTQCKAKDCAAFTNPVACDNNTNLGACMNTDNCLTVCDETVEC